MKNDIGLTVSGFTKEALEHLPNRILISVLLTKDEEAKKAIELHNDEVSVLRTVCESTNFGLKIAIKEIKKLKDTSNSADALITGLRQVITSLRTEAGNEEVVAPSHYATMQKKIEELEGKLETETYKVAVVESNFKYETGRLNQEVKELKEENDALLQAPVIKELADLRNELKATNALLDVKVKDKGILEAKLRVLGRILDTKNRYMDEMEKNLKESHLINK